MVMITAQDAVLFIAAARVAVNLTNAHPVAATRAFEFGLFQAMLRTAVHCWAGWSRCRNLSDVSSVKVILTPLELNRLVFDQPLF